MENEQLLFKKRGESRGIRKRTRVMASTGHDDKLRREPISMLGETRPAGSS